MITQGSVRGKNAAPQDALLHKARCPPALSNVCAPQTPQWRDRDCQYFNELAKAASPASCGGRFIAAARSSVATA